MAEGDGDNGTVSTRRNEVTETNEGGRSVSKSHRTTRTNTDPDLCAAPLRRGPSGHALTSRSHQEEPGRRVRRVLPCGVGSSATRASRGSQRGGPCLSVASFTRALRGLCLLSAPPRLPARAGWRPADEERRSWPGSGASDIAARRPARKACPLSPSAASASCSGMTARPD